MTPDTLDEQLTKYLADAHSIERQALAQLKTAPKLAGDERIAAVFSTHLTETEEHERLVRERIEARGAKPSVIKDIAGAVIGKGFGAFAAAQPDTPGKLVVHAFSYEHLEKAAYDLLRKVAERAQDEPTAQIASRIGAEEGEMVTRLAGCFDRAAELALGDGGRATAEEQLPGYLADAHAIEAQALQLLEKSPKLAGDDELARAYEEHRAETEGHQQLITGRLQTHGASRSIVKDAALRLGAVNWGTFFALQPDTPVKLAGFAYAFEHLEVGAYEMLRRVAGRAGDSETVSVAERILGEEQEAATRIHALFDRALDATLGAVGASSNR